MKLKDNCNINSYFDMKIVKLQALVYLKESDTLTALTANAFDFEVEESCIIEWLKNYIVHNNQHSTVIKPDQ